ncbi:MAG: hypothetical protein AB1411_08060 [Nitrospirota bacterium]
MNVRRRGGLMAGLILLLAAGPWPIALAQQDPLVVFAVVTKVPRDKSRVTAQVSEGGPPSEAVLIATDSILDNLIWKKLEICHALRVEAWKTPDGYRVVSVRVLDAGMLPMTLQGIAGDCLLKKALEFAPQID